ATGALAKGDKVTMKVLRIVPNPRLIQCVYWDESGVERKALVKVGRSQNFVVGMTLEAIREVLYLVNRPGNAGSHEGCVPWIDRAIELVRPHAGEITLRGDTDFTLTGELDRWDSQGIKFLFGMDAHPKVVQLAEALPEEAWKPLERLPRYEI